MRKKQFLLRLFSTICFIGLFLVVTPLFTAAQQRVGISIDRNETMAEGRYVTLTIHPPSGVRLMQIVNDEKNFSGEEWVPIERTVEWKLSEGAGTKYVYVRFLKDNDRVGGTFQDDIYLRKPRDLDEVGVSLNDGDEKTHSRFVTIDIAYPMGVDSVKISNRSDFKDEQYQKIADEIRWPVTPGSGEKTVYIRVRDVNNRYKDFERDIIYEEPVQHIDEGTVVRSEGGVMYYVGFDGTLHEFVDQQTFYSWYDNVTDIRFISDAKIRSYDIGTPMCIRSGTWLIRFTQSQQLYIAEPGCILRPILSETHAFIVYGPSYKERIIELDQSVVSLYRIRDYALPDLRDDRDRDGIHKDEEATFGSSDQRVDTDSDGLSDYEEVFVWFTNPARVDTDGDGVADGAEVPQGRSPNGVGQLEEIPENLYDYPNGSVLKHVHGNGAYYYKRPFADFGSVSRRAFTDNAFNDLFAIRSAFYQRFTVDRDEDVDEDEEKLHYPTIYRGDDSYELL